MRSKIAPVFWIVLLAGIPAGLYYVYVSAQRQEITELNQRELGRASENLKEILRNGVQTVRNLSKSPSYTCTFSERQPYLRLADGLECADFKDHPGVPKESEVDAIITDNGLKLSATDVTAKDHSLDFDVRLEKALDELVVTDGFEYLFLARGDGMVIFQTRRGERKRWLDQLRWFDRHARDESVPVSNPLRLQKITDLQTAAGTPVTFESLSRTSNSIPVQIAGAAYRLHVQPFLSIGQLRYGKNTDEKKSSGEKPETGTLVLGGLVNESASVQEALSIEPLYALVLALLLGIGLLSWPLLKFFVLAPRERFKFLDFALLLLSTSATLGFLTILLLDAEGYLRLKGMGEKRLKVLSSRLHADFLREIADMRSQLTKFDELAAGPAAGLFDCQTLFQGTHLLAAEPESPAAEFFKIDSSSPYPSFVTLFWSRGRDGKQIGKLTTVGANTAQVKVAQRNYFREAQAGHLWDLASDPPTQRGFFLQPYRSNTTGDFETGLSIRSRLKTCDPKFGEANIAVLTTLLGSFQSRPLPPDMGFMVLDRSGRVLYHMDERRALREDVFEETGKAGSLRAIILTGRPEALTAPYRGAPHRFWIEPVKGITIHKHRRSPGEAAEPPETAGWFLVTFQNLELSRTVNSEAMISALVWGVFYFVLAQFLPAALFVWMGPKQMAWLWPNRDKALLYRRLTIQLSALVVIAAFFLSFAEGWTLLTGSCAIGATGLTIAIAEYHRWLRAQERDNPEPVSARSISRSRVAAAALLLIVVSVLPAAGFFRFAWEQEIGALLRYEADHIEQMQDDLSDELTERGQKLFLQVYGREWRARTDAVFAVRKAAIDKPVFAAYESRSNREWSDVLAPLKPVYNDASAQLRYRRSGPVGSEVPLHIRIGWCALPGGLVLIAAVAFWIHYAGRKLLLADLTDRKQPLDDVLAAVEARRENRENQILVVSSAVQESAVRERLRLPLIKAKAAVAGADPEPARAIQGASLTDAICASDLRAAALENLEALADSGGGVVFSRLNPLEYCIAHAFSTGGAGFADAEQRKWAEIFERYSVVSLPVEAHDHDGYCDHQALYWSIWNSCTDVEKLLLIHVAEEGFANPREDGTVRDLIRRGLLVLGPELRVFSSGFQHFLMKVEDMDQVKQWEKPGRFGWNHARWVLTAVFVAVVFFLVSTQRQALAPIIAFVATLTGAVSGILKLVADFSPKKSS